MGIYLDIIKSILLEQDQPYKSGDEHNIFIDKEDNNRVIRVNKKGGIAKWVKVFINNPELFPVVYEEVPGGAKLERLDTVKAQKEYEEIDNTLKSTTNFEGILNMVGSGNPPNKLISELIEWFKTDRPQLLKPFLSFVKLVNDVHKRTGVDRVDAHKANFGYSKSGKLKMVDY